MEKKLLERLTKTSLELKKKLIKKVNAIQAVDTGNLVGKAAINKQFRKFKRKCLIIIMINIVF